MCAGVLLLRLSRACAMHQSNPKLHIHKVDNTGVTMYHVTYLDLAGFRREAVLLARHAAHAVTRVQAHAENGVSEVIDVLFVDGDTVYHIV